VGKKKIEVDLDSQVDWGRGYPTTEGRAASGVREMPDSMWSFREPTRQGPPDAFPIKHARLVSWGSVVTVAAQAPKSKRAACELAHQTYLPT
jgi:hypothetical protein